MVKPMLGLSLMLSNDFLKCTYPLFENGEVEILEWSFDTKWGLEEFPAWALDLLNNYSAENRLLGHGVSLSLFSGNWTNHHERWISLFEKECKNRHYRQISEHFGFITEKSSAPLPVPITDDLLSLSKERLKRVCGVMNSPIGIENLAFAFSRQDVFSQGRFLGELLEQVDGFLLLDLHNIYCQMANFNIDADQILNSYPLEQVIELHVSGGSWSTSSELDRRIRRDTHDNSVPPEVFNLLRMALRRCPNVECVILERLGDSLGNSEESKQFTADFRAIQALINEVNYAR